MKSIIILLLVLTTETLVAQTKDEKYYKEIGNKFFVKADYSNALLYYDSCLIINPKYADAHNNIGLVNFRQNKIEAAILNYTKAIGLNNNFEIAISNRSNAFLTLNKPVDALKDLESLARINPKHPFINDKIKIVKSMAYAKFPEKKAIYDSKLISIIDQINKERTKKEELYAPILSQHGIIYEEFSEGLISVYSNGKCNVLNERLETVIKSNFSSISKFSDGLAYFDKMDGYQGGSGFIDKQGNIVKEFNWSRPLAENFKNGVCFFFDFKGGTEGFIMNRNFQFINREPIYFHRHIKGYAFDNVAKTATVEYLNGEVAIIDKNGNKVKIFNRNIVYSNPWRNMFFFKENGYYGWLNSSGELVQPAKFKFKEENGEILSDSFTEDGIEIDAGENRKTMIDSLGNVLIDFDYSLYERNYVINSRNALRVMKNGKYGFVDANHKVLIPFIYDELGYFEKEINLYQVSISNRWGIVNKNNDVVIPLVYDEIQKIMTIGNKYFIIVKLKGKWGVIDETNSTIVDFLWDEISYRPEEYGFWRVKKDNLWGLLNFDGKSVFPCKYGSIDLHVGAGFIRTGFENEAKYFTYKGFEIKPQWKQSPPKIAIDINLLNRIVSKDCSNIRAKSPCLVSTRCDFNVYDFTTDTNNLVKLKMKSIGILYDINLSITYQLGVNANNEITYELRTITCD